MARKLMCPPTLTLLVLVVALAWMCAVPPCSAADTMVPTMTTAAASGDKVPVPATGGVVPVGSTPSIPTATEATTAATATASKKFPLAPPDLLTPAAEVGTALPVPVPETLPSAEGLGLGPNGFGTNGGFGGCCGGFGYNGGLGYNNGPLFFNSAPARKLRLRDGLAPLLVAGVAAMFYV